MISFIVATTGRPTLEATLRSIECWPGDEILLVGDNLSVNDPRVTHVQCAVGGDWGHAERNFAMPLASRRYIAHIDDDDVYAPGARAAMAEAIKMTPGRPIIFRMRYKNGTTLWADEVIRCGNVGTPMVIVPNMPTRLGNFGSFYGGDAMYYETMKWAPEEFVWRPEVTVLIRPHSS